MHIAIIDEGKGAQVFELMMTTNSGAECGYQFYCVQKSLDDLFDKGG